MAATTTTTFRLSSGDDFAEPNGNRIGPSLGLTDVKPAGVIDRPVCGQFTCHAGQTIRLPRRASKGRSKGSRSVSTSIRVLVAFRTSQLW